MSFDLLIFILFSFCYDKDKHKFLICNKKIKKFCITEISRIFVGNKTVKEMENQKKLVCDGNCIETHGEHKGEVKPVSIFGFGFKKLNFHYCQNTINEDRKRGFTVEVES